MIVLHGKERETCVEGRERAWKTQKASIEAGVCVEERGHMW